MGSHVDIKMDSNWTKQLTDLKCSDKEIDAFYTSCVRELLSRLLAKVIPRTPVGVYPKGSGRMGGTLRRGWTLGKNIKPNQFANSAKISKLKGAYNTDLINATEYAEYVEYGHRTRGGDGWVDGQFMLTKSEHEIEAEANLIINNKLNKFLERFKK